MTEEVSIRLLYNDVVIQPYRIVNYNFDEIRFYLSHNPIDSEWTISEGSDCDVEKDQFIAAPGTFFSSDFRKDENDDQCNVIKIDFNDDMNIETKDFPDKIDARQQNGIMVSVNKDQ